MNTQLYFSAGRLVQEMIDMMKRKIENGKVAVDTITVMYENFDVGLRLHSWHLVVNDELDSRLGCMIDVTKTHFQLEDYQVDTITKMIQEAAMELKQ